MNTRRFVQTAMLLLLDLMAFGILYFAFGFHVAIITTVVTKVLGIVVVFSQYGKYKRLKASSAALNEKLQTRHANPDLMLTDADMQGLPDVMFVGIYSHVAAFVLIPGPLSDVIGALFVFPPTGKRVINRFMAMAQQMRNARMASSK